MAPTHQDTAIGVLALIIMVTIQLEYTGCRAEICTRDICEYDFVLRYSRPLVWHNKDDPYVGGYDVVLNGTDLVIGPNPVRLPNDPVLGTVVSPDDVITADGYQRNIITINGQFPGPTLEVMAGSQVSGITVCYL